MFVSMARQGERLIYEELMMGISAADLVVYGQINDKKELTTLSYQ
jgi:hypothetical protein